MSKFNSKNIFYSFGYAIEGIIYSIKTQRNIKIHLIAFILVIILSFLLKISRIEFILLLIVSCIVITTEIVNTSIEAVVDLYIKEKHPLAKIAKDTAAGAVLVSSIFSLIIGLLVFLKPLYNYIYSFKI